MIEVELPDGTIAEFPDGTSQDVMRNALRKRFGSAQPAQAPPSEAYTQARSEMSAMTQNPTTPRSIPRRIDDAVRGVADAATFGFSDEIAAGLGSLTGIGGESGQYDQNLAQQRQRDATGGMERFGGQLAGAVAMPGAAAKSTLGAVRNGALAGGLYGFGSGEGSLENRASSAAMGGAVGGAAGGALRGVANTLGTRAAAKAIPSNDMIRKAAEAAYQTADNAGIVIRPEATKRLAREVVNDLTEFGYDPALQPGVTAILKRLQGLQGQNVTLKGMDVIRRVAGNAAQSFDNPSQQKLARQIIDRIDDHVTNLKQPDVLMGDVRKGLPALKQGRELWGRLRRSEMVDTAVAKADLRAASTGSGGNADNATRQNVRRLLEKPKGMSATEQKAANAVVRGSPGQNALRLAGKLSPSGNGLMAALGIGGTMVNPAVGIASLGGMAAKSAADRMTAKNVERLSQIIRSGGKSAQELAKLARGGQLAIPEVKRIEALAKMLGVSVPEMSAIVAEQASSVGQR
jgi:hypothetical protein